MLQIIKKIKSLAFGSALFLALGLGVFNFAKANESLENGGNAATCYSSVNDCWFWGCWYVYRCGASGTDKCSNAKVDGADNEGKCN
jgi:hypothetical protein